MNYLLSIANLQYKTVANISLLLNFIVGYPTLLKIIRIFDSKWEISEGGKEVVCTFNVSWGYKHLLKKKNIGKEMSSNFQESENKIMF